MICYRDMTFCDFGCKSTCKRKLTEKIKREAEDFRLPICLYVDKPACFKEEL